MWPWLAIAVAITSWELLELFSQPRKSHPTLSSLTDSALSTHPTRFVGYLLWMAAGWFLIRDLQTRRRAAAPGGGGGHE